MSFLYITIMVNVRELVRFPFQKFNLSRTASLSGFLKSSKQIGGSFFDFINIYRAIVVVKLLILSTCACAIDITRPLVNSARIVLN